MDFAAVGLQPRRGLKCFFSQINMGGATVVQPKQIQMGIGKSAQCGNELRVA